jgi:hypothetical protein
MGFESQILTIERAYKRICCLLGLGCPKQAFAKIATPRLRNAAVKIESIDVAETDQNMIGIFKKIQCFTWVT